MKDGKALILIVDDNRKNLKLLGQILREEGHNITLAEDGERALIATSAKKPDLILLDIMMPGMNGFKVCKRLKKEDETKDIPVIFLTAKNDKKDVIDALRLGAVDYITKPFDTDELLTRVNTHLELKIARDTIATQKADLENVNAALKDANAAKDKFFYIIAHDLGDLFNGLLSFCDILTNKNAQLSDEEKEGFLEIIQKSSQQGFTLLRNLFEWSGVQTGEIEFKPESLNLKASIDANIEMRRFSEEAESKNIALSSDIPDDMFVFADSNMVDTIIKNLVSNAINFTSEGGKITISARRSSDFIRIAIADTGIGISPEDLGKLFHIDVNHKAIGKSTEKGAGLGLILCKELVEKNGGQIWLESREWKGTTAYVTLPSPREESELRELL
jgi:two-component system sensor histidine kinase/response regulator